MPAYTSEDEQLRDGLVVFNSLLSAARNMIAKLASGSARPITSSTVVPEIANFQRQFNEARGVVFTQIGWMTDGKFKPAAMSAELQKSGLSEDGKYGPRTSTALALTMWASSEKPDLINEIGTSVPSEPQSFTKYYLAKKELFDETLRDIPIPQGVVQPPPIPAPQPPAQVVEAANNAGTQVVQPAVTPVPIANGPTQVAKFDDHVVIGQGKGRLSFGVILAGIIGVATLGGISFYFMRKKRMI
jgi:hypothetical protein